MNEMITTADNQLVNNPEAMAFSVEQGLIAADKFVNRNYLINLNEHHVLPIDESLKVYNKIRLYCLEKIVYDKNENINDKLVSVYSALQDLESTVLLIIDSDGDGIKFYLGIRSENDAATAGMILEKSLIGNFPGSVVNNLKNSAIEEVLANAVRSESITSSKNVASVTIVPSSRDEDKDKFVQGIEKFIDAMNGDKYTAIIIANPMSKDVLELRKRGLEELYSNISPYSELTLSYGTNFSEAVSEGNSKNFSSSLNKSISNTNSHSAGSSSSQTSSKSKGSNWNFGIFGTNSGKSESSTCGTNSTDSWSQAVTSGTTETISEGVSTNKTLTEGDSRNLSMAYQNKTVANLMEKIDKHLERICQCESFGLWECACYFISQDVQTSVVAANTYKALMAGNESSVENSFVNIWGTRNIENTNNLLSYLNYCVHPQIEIGLSGTIANQVVTPGCLISGNELPVLMGVPHKSVTGLTAMSMAEFGRNIYKSTSSEQERVINIGKIYHMGKEEDTEVSLDVNSFASHCFIAGSTGSGKSNTSYRILDEMLRNNVKFLVIEPAKGEYKKDLGGINGINIFCTNPNQYRMLRLNPFKFNENLHVLEHLDRLIEIFNACWPMYAAMPAIFKEAIEKSYEKCGWELSNSIHIDNGRNKFPTFVDLLETLPEIINNSSYSADSKGDYTGALVTRVKSMTTGISGQIFCHANDIDDKVLFDENTIVDLSRVGAAETKSLIMGILVMKLNEHRMATTVGENVPLHHVTVLEEAHNLLKRTSTDQSQEGSNLMGKSVEMISSSIAEMRTYGEGFIIIDQSPTAVDISAIKNTNTKIIMRLPEQGDCEAIGKAMALNEDQINELSKLGKGKAVILQNNWLESVLTSVYFWGNKYKKAEEVNEYSSVMKLRGQLATAMLKQYNQQQFDKNILYAYVKESLITEHKKMEYQDWINRRVPDNKINAQGFADLLMELLCCEGLFKALPPIFEQMYLGEIDIDEKIINTAKQWYEMLLSAIDKYAIIGDINTKKKIVQFMIYTIAKRFNEDHRYLILYNAVYK